MEKSGIRSNAARTFKNARKIIQEALAERIGSVKERIANAATGAEKKALRQESKRLRAEASERMTRAAEQYLSSGMATKTGISDKFDDYLAGVPEEGFTEEGMEYNPRAMIEEMIGDSSAKAAEYMDASEEKRREMEARHFAGSESIQTLAELQQAGKMSLNTFYANLHEVAVHSYLNRDISPDELQGFINTLI